MPTRRVLMRKVKRILELHFVSNMSVRAITRSIGVGRSLCWPENTLVYQVLWFPQVGSQ